MQQLVRLDDNHKGMGDQERVRRRDTFIIIIIIVTSDQRKVGFAWKEKMDRTSSIYIGIPSSFRLHSWAYAISSYKGSLVQMLSNDEVVK